MMETALLKNTKTNEQLEFEPTDYNNPGIEYGVFGLIRSFTTEDDLDYVRNNFPKGDTVIVYNGRVFNIASVKEDNSMSKTEMVFHYRVY